MYRVIIADDEESVRNRLKTMVEKFSDDFMVVGCFENGFDTLESGSQLEPDILITDIRMPYISGIELIRHLKMDFPLMQFIIVSGYDSFDYAKEAISLGVAGYLTKPVSSLEMKSVLYKAKDALDKQLQMDLSIKNLEVKAKTSMRFLQSEDLNRLIKLKQIPANFANKLVEDGIDLNHPYQVMAVYDADSDELEFDRQDLLYFSLKKAIDEEFASCLYYFFLSDNQMILLLQKDEKFNDEELMLKFNGILAMVKRAASISVSCGVSDIMNAPVNYRKMYRHAKRSLEYRTVLGSNMVFSFEDLEKENGTPQSTGKIDENEYKNLTYLISYGKKTDVISSLEKLIVQISTPNYKDSYFYILSNILDAIVKACISLSEFYQDFDSQAEITTKLYGMKTQQNLIDYLVALAERVIKVNESRKLSGVESSYERILHFIDMNFTNPNLLIEDVANELSYSVSYISAILKRNGTSFTKITTDLRMKKALTLLSDQNNRIITIARDVGYTDPYYFSHCFKKYTGLSPDEYRKTKSS